MKYKRALQSELLVTQDVWAHLAIASIVDAGNLLASADGSPDNSIKRAWPFAGRLFCGNRCSSPASSSRRSYVGGNPSHCRMFRKTWPSLGDAPIPNQVMSSV